MINTTLLNFSRNIIRYFEKVTEKRETLIINWGKDKSVVIISLDEYNSLFASKFKQTSAIKKLDLESQTEK